MKKGCEVKTYEVNRWAGKVQEKAVSVKSGCDGDAYFLQKRVSLGTCGVNSDVP